MEIANGDPLSGKRLEDLKQLILYNLACINYAEIMAYLDRGPDDASQYDDQSLVETVNRIEREKQEDDLKEARAKEELYIQEREVQY